MGTKEKSSETENSNTSCSAKKSVVSSVGGKQIPEGLIGPPSTYSCEKMGSHALLYWTAGPK